MANPSLADAMGKAPSMQVVNLVTTASLEAQFNPEEFSEKLGAVYAKLAVPGASHQVKQFIHTEDVQLRFDLFWRANVDGDQVAAAQRILDARTFLYATVYPWSAPNIQKGGAPRVLFIWPNFISLTCVVTSIEFTYTSFNKTGAPTAYRAALVIEEIRDVHITMEEILANATQRSPGS